MTITPSKAGAVPQRELVPRFTTEKFNKRTRVYGKGNLAPLGYEKCHPCGPLVEIIKDKLYAVEGIFPIGSGYSAEKRTMTVVVSPAANSHGRNLVTVFNAIRVGGQTEIDLLALGKIDRIVRLGTDSGSDDVFYVQQYGCELWAHPRMKWGNSPKLRMNRDLTREVPFPGECKVIVLDTKSATPEVCIVLADSIVDGGMLITCSAIQNRLQSNELSDLQLPFCQRLCCAGSGIEYGELVTPRAWVRDCSPDGTFRSLKVSFEEIAKHDYKHCATHWGPLSMGAAKETREIVEGNIDWDS
jgi:hypothetical protein